MMNYTHYSERQRKLATSLEQSKSAKESSSSTSVDMSVSQKNASTGLDIVITMVIILYLQPESCPSSFTKS